MSSVSCRGSSVMCRLDLLWKHHLCASSSTRLYYGEYRVTRTDRCLLSPLREVSRRVLAAKYIVWHYHSKAAMFGQTQQIGVQASSLWHVSGTARLKTSSEFCDQPRHPFIYITTYFVFSYNVINNNLFKIVIIYSTNLPVHFLRHLNK